MQKNVPLVVVDPAALKRLDIEDLKFQDEIPRWHEASQLVSNELRKEIEDLLIFLDNKNHPWAKLILDHYIPTLRKNSDLQLWSMFLLIVLGEERLKFANRFSGVSECMCPLVPTSLEDLEQGFIHLGDMKQKFTTLRNMAQGSSNSKDTEQDLISLKDILMMPLIYANDILQATRENPPAPSDERAFGICDEGSTKIKWVFLDNLIEILALILMKIDEEPEKFIEWIQAIGISPKNSKKIGSKAISLKKDIKEHIERKCPQEAKEKDISLSNLRKQRDYINFWHRELVKRKFYLETYDNKEMKDKIDSIFKYVNSIYLKKQCNPCIFDIDYLNFNEEFDDEKAWQCECNICEIKKDIVKIYSKNDADDILRNASKSEAYILYAYSVRELFAEYKIFAPDVFYQYNSAFIYSHYARSEELPFHDIIGDNIKGAAYAASDTSDDEMGYFTLMKETLIAKKDGKIDGKLFVDNDSMLLGLHIWDTKNADANISIAQIIANAVKELGWFKEILNKNKLFKEDLETTNDNPTKEIIDSCRNYYDRINVSINNINCKIVSINAATSSKKKM